MSDQTPTNNADELDKLLKAYRVDAPGQLTPLGFNELKWQLHRYTQKMVLAELRELNSKAAGENCCLTHYALVDRITTIEKELKTK